MDAVTEFEKVRDGGFSTLSHPRTPSEVLKLGSRCVVRRVIYECMRFGARAKCR